MLGDTAGHRCSCVCSGVWGCKCLWSRKLNKLLDPYGQRVRKHCPFLPTNNNFRFISIIFMAAFLVAFIVQWVEFLQVPHQLPLLLVCLAWILTSSSARESLCKLSPLHLRKFHSIGTSFFQKMAFYLAEIKLAKEMPRKPRTLTLAPL